MVSAITTIVCKGFTTVPGSKAADLETASMGSTFSSNFTSKEVTYITASWGQNPEELASVLSTRTQASNRQVLEEWLENNDGDRRRKLYDVFQEEYPNMAALIIFQLIIMIKGL